MIVSQFCEVANQVANCGTSAGFVAGSVMWVLVIHSLCWKSGMPTAEAVAVVKAPALRLITELVGQACASGVLELETGPHRAMAACDDAMSEPQKLMLVVWGGGAWLMCFERLAE